MKVSSIIMTTLFIGASGVIAGILFAPHKGSRTRRKISKKRQEYTDYLGNNINEIADSASQSFENMENQSIRLGEKAIDKAKKVTAEVKRKLN